MKRIIILLIGLISVAQAQFAPTSARTRFANGIAFNTRDTSVYNAADSLVVVINRQGRMMYRSTDGYWKILAINNDTAQMLINYLRKSDTANMLSPYLRKSDTLAMLSPYARTSSLGIFVPYTGAAANLDMGTFRISSRSAANDSILARSSAGGVIATNSGTAVASYGAGGSAEMTFNGFAGYNANRSASYTARSFTDKNYVDSSAGLRKLVADTFFTTGYTTRARTKQIIDSLGAAKQNVLTNPVTGTGTTNTLPKFTGTSTIGNSLITDNGTLVTVGGNTRINGSVGIGAAPSSTEIFTLSQPLTTGIGPVAFFSNSQIGANATSAAAYFIAQSSTAASSFTLPNLEYYRAEQGTFGAGSTVTTQTGFNARSSLISATNNYGFRGQIAAGTGRWNLYMDGTANNYLNGRTLFGTTTDNATDRIQVNGSSLVGNIRTSSNTISSTNTNGNIILDANGTGQVQVSDPLVGAAGATFQRGRFTSLVVNKDSIPITTSNFWALQVDTSGTPYTNRVNRRDISAVHTGSIAFDTSSRTLTINQISGGTTSVVIPRGTASGTSGITALSSSRTGNLVTVSGDNGSSTIFSVRDADSSAALQSLTAGNGLTGSPYNGGSPLTWVVDTSVISTKANVSGLLVGYATTGDNALKLSISDTTSMLSNYNRKSDTATMLLPYLRKTDTATMLLPFVQYSDTANQMSGYLRKNFALLLQDTSSAFSNYLRKSDTLTMLAPYARTANLPSLAPYVKYTDTASLVAPYLRKSDTAAMLSPYSLWSTVNAALALKLNISDTASMLSNRLRISDTATMLLPYTRVQRFTDSLTAVQSRVQTKLALADTANMLSGYTRLQRFTDSLTAVQARIQTKQPLGAYITLADSSTILAGRWLPNRSADSIAVIRALANSRGTVFSVATNNGTGISGGTITSTGTLAIDTVLLSTRAWRQKAVDSLNGLINSRVRIADTATMLTNYLRKTDTATMLSPYYRTSTATASLAGKVNVSDTSTMLSNYRRSSTLILNSNLANSTISGIALGGNLNNHLNGYGISGTAYNGALNQTWLVDTAAISTKANVTGALVAKLNISDTAAMLSNRLRISDTLTMLSRYLRKSDTLTMLNPYLRKIDTSSMLSPYARTANLPSLAPYLLRSDSLSGGYTTWLLTKKKVDSLGAVKLNVSDTATMLSNYYRTSTATGALSLKLNISDTATMLSNRLKISDTATMLSRYLRKSDTATMLAPFVQYSDTANQMNGYIRKNFALLLQDTATAFGNYLRKSDTATMLNGYVRIQRFSDSLNAVQGRIQTKLALSDTSSMLSNYRRTSTLIQQSEVSGLSTSLAAKLNISDTSTMLLPYLRKTDTLSMLSNYRRTTTLIENSGLRNSTISGVALGGTLNNLNFGNGMTGAASYNGSAAQSIRVDTNVISTKANVTALLLPKLSLTDTASMLSNYARKSGDTFTGRIFGSATGNAMTLTAGTFFRQRNSTGNAGSPAWEQVLSYGTPTTNYGSVQFGNEYNDNTRTSYRIVLNNGSTDYVAQSIDGATGVITVSNTLNAGSFVSTGSATIGTNIVASGTAKSAGLIQSISVKTSNYTLTTNDHTVIFDVSAANRTATLPAGVEGQIFVIKMKGGDNTKQITINPNGSQTIEGVSTYSIFGSSCGDAAYTFQFVSGNWYIISSFIPQCL